MSYTVRRKRGEKVYLYEVFSDVCKKTGKKKKQYRYIGIEDPVSGEISSPRKSRWSRGNQEETGVKAPGLKEIARVCGYSVSTVHKALERDSGVAVKTAETIRKQAFLLGWRPPEHSRKYPILIILPENKQPLDQYVIQILNPLKDCIKAHGYQALFCCVDNLESVDFRCVCGVISIDYVSNLAKNLPEKLQVPLVCINDYSNQAENVYSVVSDERSAFQFAVSHLHQMGHRRIALLQSSRTFCASRRQEAFEIECAKYHLEKEVFCFNDWGFTGAVREIRDRGFTGVIVPGESEIQPFLNVVNKLGIRIPEELSAVVWENRYTGILLPGFTSCAQDFAQLAGNAVEMIDQLLAKKYPAVNMQIPYLFCLRQSVRHL